MNNAGAAGATSSGRRQAANGVWLLLPILLLAAWVRLPGTLYQIPLHFDEGIYVQNVLCDFPPTGTYYHPFLGRYLLTVAEAIPCVRSALQGHAHPAREARAAFLNDPGPFMTLGRSVTMMLAVVAVALCWALGRALGGPTLGFGAALLMAVAPSSVILSNNLGHWTLAGCLILAVFLQCSRCLDQPASGRRLGWLGVLFGLAMAAVYTNALLGLPILIMLWERWRRQRAGGLQPRIAADLALLAVCTVVAHFAGNFTAVLNPGGVLHDIATPEASLLADDSAHPGYAPGYATNVGWYVQALFNNTFGLGAVVATAGYAGLLIAGWRRRSLWLAMMVFTLTVLFVQPLLVLMTTFRYVTPVMGVVSLAAAWLFTTLGERLARIPALARVHPAAVLLVLAALPGLLMDMRYHRALALTPSRLQARQWIEANIPSGSTLVQSVEFMGPAVADCTALKDIPGHENQQPCYNIRIAPVDAEHFEKQFIDYLHGSGADYAIYTAATPPGTLRRMRRTLTVSDSLQHQFPLLARFTQPGLEDFYEDTATVNAPIEIYRLR